MSRRTALVFLYVLAACLGFGCSRAPDEPGEKPGVTQPAGMQRAPSVSDRGMRSAKSGEGLRFQPSDDPTEESLSEWRQGAAIGYGHFIQQPEWAKYRNGISREEADELFD